MQFTTGQEVGGYMLLEPVGEGGFAEVWKATRKGEEEGPFIALKIGRDERLLERMASIANLKDRLSHPDIVTIVEVDPSHEPPFIAYDYVEGETLRERLERGALEPDEAVGIFRRMLGALGAAHEAGIVHRDLKPANILLPEDGGVRVTDFDLGLVRDDLMADAPLLHSVEGPEAADIAGTVEYMAPEQRRGEEVDQRADIYAAGLILFEMLTGERPQPGDLPGQLQKGIPKTLDRVFARCYGRKEKRYADVEEILADLEHLSVTRETPRIEHYREGRIEVEGDKLVLHHGSRAESLVTPDDLETMVSFEAGSIASGPEGKNVFFEPFRMDRFPVTNREYREYVLDAGVEAPRTWPGGTCPEERAFHPVTGIDLSEAQSYAEWAGKRLPTEIEWERAARGTDDRIYPWGNAFDAERCNVKETGILDTIPIGLLPAGASPSGCMDMAGNVWEWTATPRDEENQVLKGGSFFSASYRAQAKFRGYTRPDVRSRAIGFRCAQGG